MSKFKIVSSIILASVAAVGFRLLAPSPAMHSENSAEMPDHLEQQPETPVANRRFPPPVERVAVENSVSVPSLQVEIEKKLATESDALEMQAKKHALEVAQQTSELLGLDSGLAARFSETVAELHESAKSIGDRFRSGAIGQDEFASLAAAHQLDGDSRIRALLGPQRFAALEQFEVQDP